MRRYPAYRDSGVEWLGEVPAGWRIARLKHVVEARRPITYGIVQAGPDTEGGVPYIRPADMSDEAGVADLAALHKTAPEIAKAYQRSTVQAGDLVCSIGPSFGKAMIVPPGLDGANLTQGTARVAVARDSDARYVFWVLRSYRSVQQWESSIGGATFRALNLEPLAETYLALPPLAEQRAIAAFLDRETGKIDALVAEQRRLVALLREKRQAVITHAVTRGLDPAAPLKSSGMEWLGDVPEGWIISQVGRHVSILSGFAFQSEAFSHDETDIPLLRGVNVGIGSIDWSEAVYWRRAEGDRLAAFELQVGDLVIGMDRPWITGGLRLATLSGDDVPSLLLQRVAAIRPDDTLSRDYLALLLRSESFRNHALPETTGVSVPHISPSQIADFPVALPPREMQDKIVAELSRQNAAMNDLLAEAHAAIALLQERRAALISAAVTGRIDVRDATADATTSAPEAA